MKKWYLCLVLLFNLIKIEGQDQQYLFSNFNKINGLSQNRITSFLRDNKGFNWIGTYEGLNRFDGYTFKIFKNNPIDTTSIRDNIVTGLFEDNDGYIWINTRNSIDIFNPETETFDHSQKVFNGKLFIPSSIRHFQIYDRDKNILFAFEKFGIYKYITNQDSLIKLKVTEKFNNKIITDIKISLKGNIWISCTNAFIYEIDGRSYELLDSIKIPINQNVIYNSYIDSDDDIWIYHMDNIIGAIQVNTTTKKIIQYNTK